MALRLGTSSWSAESWLGCFYPEGMPPADWLAFYAKQFDSVEIDATFYRTPAPAVVEGWAKKTPPGFVFACKAPQVITHEKRLTGAEAETESFLKIMSGLGPKLGPVLFQFPYFNKADMPSPVPFFDQIKKFVKTLPRGPRYAVEVRNKGFLVPAFLDVLRTNNIALALIDHPFMLKAADYRKRMDLLTADFVYIRWLGDRKGIEAITTKWDKVLVERDAEMAAWVPYVKELAAKYETYAYFNNHYAGHAPGSIALFKKVWAAAGGGPIGPKI